MTERTNYSDLSLMTFPILPDLIVHTMTPDACVKLAKTNGINHIDLMDIPFRKIGQYCKATQKYGVRVYSYIATVSFLLPEHRWQEKLSKELRKAVSLGAQLFHLVPVRGEGDLEACQKLGEKAWKNRMVDYFKCAVQLGAKVHLKVCFETMPQDASMLCGKDDCLEILSRVKGLGFIFDTANVLAHGEDPIAYYRALKPYILYTHLKDVKILQAGQPAGLFIGREYIKSGERMVCCVYGEGVIPIGVIYDTMRKDGYTGLFALEYCRPKGIFAGYEKHDAHLKRFLALFATEKEQ